MVTLIDYIIYTALSRRPAIECRLAGSGGPRWCDLIVEEETSMKICVLAAALVGFAMTTPALADLKCGDGHHSVPFEFSQGDLVTTWAGPVPEKAKVSFATSAPFDSAARDLGQDIPSGFPEKYTQNIKQVDIFNQSMAWSTQQLIEVEKKYGFIIDRDDEALPIFERYSKTGHNFITVLVQHPAVPASVFPFSSCSIVLQRGIIQYAEGKETLFLRSYFHSKNEHGDFVNFVPKGGLAISFSSTEIWFPLSLTKVISEPASYVVLDILTEKPLEAGRVPTPFRSERDAKEISFEGRKFFATRVTAKFESGKDLEDFRLRLAAVEFQAHGLHLKRTRIVRVCYWIGMR
jgi:hypothetical protein